MSIALEIWPFLIGRSYDKDYRIIVNPNFLFNNKNTFFLTEVTGDINSTEESCLFVRKVCLENSEILNVFFRVVKASMTMIDPAIKQSKDLVINVNKNNFLLDVNGRVINIVEGFILKNIDAEKISMSIDYFEEIHEILVKHFQDFWIGDTETKKIGSKTYKESNYDKYFTLKELAPLDLRSKIESSGVKIPTKFLAVTTLAFLSLLIFYVIRETPPEDGENIQWQSLGKDNLVNEEIFIDANHIWYDMKRDKKDIYFIYKFKNKEELSSVNCNSHKIDTKNSNQINISDKSIKKIISYICNPK